MASTLINFLKGNKVTSSPERQVALLASKTPLLFDALVHAVAYGAQETLKLASFGVHLLSIGLPPPSLSSLVSSKITDSIPLLSTFEETVLKIISTLGTMESSFRSHSGTMKTLGTMESSSRVPSVLYVFGIERLDLVFGPSAISSLLKRLSSEFPLFSKPSFSS
jgi:hypothetical protein